MEKKASVVKKPTSSMMKPGVKPFTGFKPADIDASGTYKYIQIHVASKKDPSEKFVLIRGFKAFKYHKDILKNWVTKELNGLGQTANFEYTCPGGGRIKATPETKTLFVYGYSKTFGRVDHTITQAILQEAYPDYSISWSDEGY